MANGKIELHIKNPKSKEAYLSLPKHPGIGTHGCVKYTKDLYTLLKYVGPEVRLAFDEQDVLIGIEIIV